jgi:hypothetical protein
MKTLAIFVFILSFNCLKSFGQFSATTLASIRPDVQKVVSRMADDNVLKSAGVGFEGARTAQWVRYETLRKNATSHELEVLTTHKNAVVRCYAFQALAARKEAAVFPILLQHLSDDEKVATFQGCIQDTQKAGDYFIAVARLSANQQGVLDSVLLFDNAVKVDQKNQLLSALKPQGKWYNRVREIAQETHSPEAVLALARYQNKADVPLIKKLFENKDQGYYAAYAVREFPHAVFYPYLTAMFEREWKEKYYDYPKWRQLYQALAKYPSGNTYKLFERTTQTTSAFRKQTLGTYLLLALQRYPNPVFAPLKRQIRLDRSHLEELAQYKDSEK